MCPVWNAARRVPVELTARTVGPVRAAARLRKLSHRRSPPRATFAIAHIAVAAITATMHDFTSMEKSGPIPQVTALERVPIIETAAKAVVKSSSSKMSDTALAAASTQIRATSGILG